MREGAMALKEYRWRGYTWQISDEHLHLYPGAVLVKPEPKEKTKAPANKSRRAPKNKNGS